MDSSRWLISLTITTNHTLAALKGSKTIRDFLGSKQYYILFEDKTQILSLFERTVIYGQDLYGNSVLGGKNENKFNFPVRLVSPFGQEIVERVWNTETQKKQITVKLEGKLIVLEISSITSMVSLLGVIGKKFGTVVQIKRVYGLNNDIVLVTDVDDLRKGFLYYAQTIDKNFLENKG